MKAAKLLVNSIQWVNLGTIAYQVAGSLPPNKWVLAFQAVLAALLPSLHGVGHKLAFRTEQVKKD